MALQREWLDFLREQYPVGSKIVLREMGGDDPYPISPGSTGKLKRIDDIGTFHVDWDDGRGLGLVVGVDSFSVMPPEPEILKLYMPLNGSFYEYNEWGDLEDEGSDVNGRFLRRYENQIAAALKRNALPEEKERGLMRWYNEQDSVDQKVRSVLFQVEERSSILWGVAECKVVGSLTPEELGTLKEYITGQASDGWGEGFEQRAIKIEEGELYVSLWNFNDWDILTEDERFAPKVAEGLPEMCFSVLPGEGKLICIKRGESGYYPSDWDTGDPEKNRWIADYNNEKRGVTKAQE